MAYYYAQITAGICTGVSQLGAPLDLPNMVALDSYDTSRLGMAYAGGVWSEAPTAPVRVLSPRAFLSRFTASEREALEEKAMTGTQGVKNKITAFKTYVNTGGNIELDDDYIIAAVTAMETAGVIAAGRASIILA